MLRLLRQLEFRLFPPAPPVPPTTAVRHTALHAHDHESLRAWCAKEAARLGMPELARHIQIVWNARMRTTAGRAWWPERKIELNAKLLDHNDREVWRTLKHELAHLVAYERAGRRRIDPHGREWQAACADLGIAGERPYHTLPFKGHRMKRSYSYTCPSCQSTFLRVRRIRRMVACYDCCRKFTGGQFDMRFRLLERKL